MLDSLSNYENWGEAHNLPPFFLGLHQSDEWIGGQIIEGVVPPSEIAVASEGARIEEFRANLEGRHEGRQLDQDLADHFAIFGVGFVSTIRDTTRDNLARDEMGRAEIAFLFREDGCAIARAGGGIDRAEIIFVDNILGEFIDKALPVEDGRGINLPDLIHILGIPNDMDILFVESRHLAEIVEAARGLLQGGQQVGNGLRDGFGSLFRIHAREGEGLGLLAIRARGDANEHIVDRFIIDLLGFGNHGFHDGIELAECAFG